MHPGPIKKKINIIVVAKASLVVSQMRSQDKFRLAVVANGRRIELERYE
jgi:hypothetical protein